VRRAALLAAAALVLSLSACDGGDESDELIVSAASSLQTALTECTNDSEEPRIRLQFGGSDELAAQIRQGVEPDVYAAANTKLPDELAQEGLLEEPVTFATNELVVAVPKGSRVRAVDDLAIDGTRVVVGSDSVPVGSYTREVLDRLPGDTGERIEANVRSEEPDVKGIVGKLSQGAADAGFVYRTDVRAAPALRAVELDEELKPTVEYGAGVLESSDLREDAIAFVDGLRSGECAVALREAGFGRAGR
jgi:molybdate transport system substrate-binding protein